MLMALWNHKLATAQLHASTDPLGPGELSKGLALVTEIDRVASRLGGARMPRRMDSGDRAGRRTRSGGRCGGGERRDTNVIQDVSNNAR